MYIVLFCKFTQGGIGATIIFRLQIDAIIIVAILFKVELLIWGMPQKWTNSECAQR